MEYYNVSMIVENEFGIFKGKVNKLNYNGLQHIKEISKQFYTGSFDLDCEDGSYLVIPPEVVKRSILRIVYKKIE